MSLHKNPRYQIPALIEALQEHGLPHDKPSQLADAFRTGWIAGQYRKRDQKLLELGYSRGWSDHKKDMVHGLSSSDIDIAIEFANGVKP